MSKKEVVLFKSEERTSLSDVAAFLRTLADKLESNQLILRSGQDELVVTIPDSVVLELKVEDEMKRSGTKHSLEIEIEWGDGDQVKGGVSLG